MASKFRPGSKDESADAKELQDDGSDSTEATDEELSPAPVNQPYQETIFGIPVDDEDVDPEFDRRNLLKMRKRC